MAELKCRSDDFPFREFLQQMPKVELHAHLNGSLSKATITKLYEIKEKRSCIENDIQCPVDSGSLSKCFQVFKFIQSITTTPSAIRTATEDVIADFFSDGVRYLELRSTPREVPGIMSRSSYVDAMISAVHKMQETIPGIMVKLLLAIDRRNSVLAAEETVKIAEAHFNSSSSSVVGIDLSGDPSAGDVENFLPVLQYAKKVGLKLALHMAETSATDEEVTKLLQVEPHRIGHGTFIHPLKGGSKENFDRLQDLRIPLELCLTSNVISHTVTSYKEHHFPLWREINYPCVLCTDDKGVFDTSLSEEYYLAMKHFSLTPDYLWQLSYNSIDYSFASPVEKQSLKDIWQKSKERIFQLIPMQQAGSVSGKSH